MEMVTLAANVRDMKVSPNALRGNRLIPAVYYGKKEETMSLQLDYQTFRKIFLKTASTQVIDLHIDGKKKTPVLVHDIQFHPLTGAIHHVDFLHVNLNEEVTTSVPVEITGLSPAVKDFGGILTTVKHEIKVRCLPMDIPHSVQVDVSTLATLGSAVHVKELNIAKNVQVLDNPDDAVVTVSAPRVEEEATAATAATGLEGTAAEAAAAEDAAKAAAAEAAGEGKEAAAPKEEKK